MKLYISIIMMFILIGVASAQDTVLIGKQNTCITLPQECATCSYITLTSIQYPNMSREYVNAPMTKQGSSYNYTFCDTTATGKYIYCVIGDVDGIDTSACKDFEVTPSGFVISEGGSLIFFGSLIMMIILSLIFMYIATNAESSLAKIVFYCVSSIGFIMVILYTIIAVQQILFGFEGIQTGIETFWFVAKIGIWIALLSLGIIIVLIMLKAWKIKRGMLDE
jgi:hypothetical protein